MDSDPTRLGRPLSARRQHRLLAYRAYVRDGCAFVRAPSGSEFPAEPGDWLAELERDIGKPVSLQSSASPIHDDADVLVLNAASIRALSDEYGAPVNPLRFRPNVVVDGPDAAPFEEGAWVGCEVGIGDAVLHVKQFCQRCVLTTVDPETLAADPAFLQLVVDRHDARFGVYCTVVRAGQVRVGDAWSVRSAPEVRA